MTIAKVHHYVPQFLLRNFGNGKKDQVWVYDKLSSRTFPSNTRNIASESRFYDFEYQGQTLTSLEGWLSELESKAKSVINFILEADTLSTISIDQKNILADFLSVQLTRTKAFREDWNALPRLFKEHIEKFGHTIAPNSRAEEFLREATENETKEEMAKIILKAPEKYASAFLNKDWVLAATNRKHPFIFNDHPLARQNMIEKPNRGNLGLECVGIEIYFPLSPTRALVMWCPTLIELIHRRASMMLNQGTICTAAITSDPESVVKMSAALLSGKPLQYSPANVENFNSLQVIWSERYIFSSINDFTLAESMLEEHPKLKKGKRPKVA